MERSIRIENTNIDISNFLPMKKYRITLKNKNMYDIMLDDMKNIVSLA